MSWISPSLSTSNEYIKYRIEITENSTDQTLNTSNVTVSVWFWRTNTGFETYGTGTVYCTIDGTAYSASVKSSQKITNSGIYLFSKTLNIVHASDGSKALIVSAYIDHSRFTSNSQSFTASLTTIPRCSRLSVSSVELGTSMTIAISKDDPTFQNLIHWSCGSIIGTLVDGYTGSTYSWTPPVILAQEYPNVENVPINLYCVTSTADGTVLGNSSIVVQCSVPASIVPTIAVDVDDNSGNFDKYQCFLQGFSTMKVKITAAGQYGASIVSYTSIIDGKTYTGANFTTEIINASGKVTAQITVRDSRGRTSRLDYEFEVVQYEPPAVTSLTAIRCDADGNEYYQGQYCKLTFSAEITSLNGKNSASYRVEYKKQDESVFNSMTVSAYSGQASISNGAAMFAAENGSSYNIYLYAVDDFGESSKYVFSPSVFRLIHFGADGQSIAFFKRCEGDVPGDFGQAIRFSGGYVLIFDFSKFFDNISHKVVKEIIQREFTDQRIISLADHFIDAFGDAGMGLGSQISQILALASANRLDHAIKERMGIRWCGRYMDDGYLLHTDKEHLKKCMCEIQSICSSLGICLNTKKTQIVKLSHGFTFLHANEDRLYGCSQDARL